MSLASMNLLFLTYQGDVAGSTASIAYLAEGLARRGHRVFVGARRESLLFRLLESSDVRRVPMTFRGKLDLANMRQISDAVREHRIQLVNAQSSVDRYTSIFARWIHRLPVRLVHTRRQVSLSSGFPLQNWLYTKGTDLIVAVSQGVKDTLVRQGLPAEHIAVIPNGIPLAKAERPADEEAVARLRRQHDLRPGDVVIGCVARRKEQGQLLQALPLLPMRTKVVFVGLAESEVAPELVAMARRSHEVLFVGQVPPEEALHYYRLFTLHVLPSRSEGLSQTLLEAMAFGVPAIATRCAGNLDVIRDGENGILFEDGNPADMAAAIRRVLDHPERTLAMLESGRRTAIETFSLARTVAAYEEKFSELIGA